MVLNTKVEALNQQAQSSNGFAAESSLVLPPDSEEAVQDLLAGMTELLQESTECLAEASLPPGTSANFSGAFESPRK